MRLAHLSDLHLPHVRGFWPRYWNIKRGLGFLNWQLKRRVIHKLDAVAAILADIHAARPDHIAVTGDLVNLGLPAEYANASDWLGGLGPSDTVSLVPGNHDIYVDPEGARGTALWRDHMRSDAFGDGLMASSAITTNTTDHDGAAPWYETAFPYVRRIGPVAMIGLNSSHPTTIGYAGGTIGPGQRERLATILDATARLGVARVVLIHHPPVRGLAASRRALSDVAEVQDLIVSHGAEVVLHGHNHEISEEQIGAAHVFGIGSASAEYPHKGEPRASWQLISIRSRPDGGFHVTREVRGLPDFGNTVRSLSTATVEFTAHSVTARNVAKPHKHPQPSTGDSMAPKPTP